MARCSGICSPYCCAGSRPISDSDISDYDVDDGIGVVPPGAWVNSMVLLSSYFLLAYLFIFIITFQNIEGIVFRECVVGKTSFPDHSMVLLLLKCGELKGSIIHSLVFLLHNILHI